MNKVVAVVGMPGAGKSVLADRLVERGFGFIRLGQITLDIVKERGLQPTEENERMIRENLRKEHGMGAYAILNMPKIKKLLEGGNVVADNLISWSEYKILKEEFGENLIVIAVFAPPKLRYKRLADRKWEASDKDIRNRPATFQQAKERDYKEIENIEKGGPIAMADYTILNVGTEEEFRKEIDNLIKKI